MFPQTKRAHHPGRTMANPPKGAKAKPLGPNGSPVKSTASTSPHPVSASPRLASRIIMTRGQTLAVDPTAATSAPGLTDPFPSSPYAVGRKKIRIERIADERNRQVRSRTDRTLTPRAFAGRTRESSHKSACFSPRNLPNPCRTGRRLFRVRNRRTKR